MIKVPTIPKNAVKITDNYYLSKEEVEFYQLLADGTSIKDAAARSGKHKSLWEQRMTDMRNEFNLRSAIHIIAFLLRKKIID